jgi:isoleucyl-tRNA synthetase
MSEPIFAKVPGVLDFPAEEREVLRFWKAARIFEKTLSKPPKRGDFIFYEGPPTANGLPHNGHVLTRVIKDLFPRYKTMRGFRVPRKAGWDTHGLPVEVEVEKELRLHGKAAIEAYGVEPFIKKCLESVFRYTEEWEALTERVAFWVDLSDAYVTYHRSYVESVWWALSELFKKDLLYQGHKVVWWWAQGGTALSSGEVGLGYKTVDDPSVYVAFPIVGQGGLSLLVWTTTPWTLPSNMYAAVHPDFDYAIVRTQEGRRFVIASALRESLEKKVGPLEVERVMPGRELEGWEYSPPFDLFLRARPSAGPGSEGVYFRILPADFVTLDAGTGIVHVAPAFGEDDHKLFAVQQKRSPSLELFCAVKPDGTFIDGFERYAGRWVKDCDKEIQHDLQDKGLLVHAESYRHDYPFCWRADSDPLIQYARPAWYVRTTRLIDRAIVNSGAVQWIPEHIREGRFGDFLANNVDWALSRERWWGTPLNVWICERDAEHKEAPASVAEIERRNAHAFDHFQNARRLDPSLSEHLIVHKPWIDQVTFPCAACGGTMHRVPEVIDCWFDSGCMPFAQWGYPHQGKDQFERSFPADFISEGIDQTRGWFYSLLMISTLVFDKPYPHPFKTCIVLGHVTDKEGKKESKSKGNYTPPEVILDKVAMEFAVWDAARFAEKSERSEGAGANRATPARISREDFEGMDLPEGATVRVYRGDDPNGGVELPVVADKRVPRRVVVLGPEPRAKLGVVPCEVKSLKPVDVPWLPREERVTVEDPATPAPGADAFRWFFYAASPPWSATRHALSNVRALQKEFAVKLRNVYSFFTIYANIDGFRPPADRVGRTERTKIVERPEIDRWILSELANTTREVTVRMDAYDVFGATGRLVVLVDALSNWWVRRSRARFWRSGWDDDKRSAHETLYECLVALAKLTAPFTPYAAEGMYQNLVVRPGAAGARESVHLEDWPEVDVSAVDEHLSRKIDVARQIVSLGLRARMDAKIKVRQPLRKATLVVNDSRDAELVATALESIREELNVMDVQLGTHDDRREFGTTKYKPNFRSLGQRGLGKVAQDLKKAAGAEALEAMRDAHQQGSASWRGHELLQEDVEVTFEPLPGFAASADRVGTVFLDTKLDEELRGLGLLRELLNRLQAIRKELSLEYTDRIRVGLEGSERVRDLVDRYRSVLESEVLAVEVWTTRREGESSSREELREIEVEGERVRVTVARA